MASPRSATITCVHADSTGSALEVLELGRTANAKPPLRGTVSSPLAKGRKVQRFSGTTLLGPSTGRESGWSDNGTETLIGYHLNMAQLLKGPLTERYGSHALPALHALRGFDQGV